MRSSVSASLALLTRSSNAMANLRVTVKLRNRHGCTGGERKPRFTHQQGSIGPCDRSVQVALPVARNPPGWTWNCLVERMMLGRCEFRSVVELVVGEAPEPVLARFVAADERMAGGRRVLAPVLGG